MSNHHHAANGTKDVDMAPADQKMDIDEALYSRQLYVFGHEAQRKMASSDVLIVGLRGLGVEIAKNVILAGVRSVTLLDNGKVEPRDLSAQFYFTDKHIGQPRAAACFDMLASLNKYVNVTLEQRDLTPALLASHPFQVVVVPEQVASEQVKINAVCRQHGIKFIAADVRGLLAACFVDAGDAHSVSDPTGEQPLRGHVTHVTQANPGIVTVNEDRRHGLQTGDYVTFEEIEGMTQLNHSAPRQIKVLTPFSFAIEDTSSYGTYTGEGYFQQVIVPQVVKHNPLSTALQHPGTHIMMDAYMRSPGLHCLYQALSAFWEQHKRMPDPTSLDEAQKVAQVAVEIGASFKFDVDAKLVARLARTASAAISPMAALMGGVAAQEVLKCSSGKFSPLTQLFYFDAADCLPAEDVPVSEFAPMNSRYDDQIAVFGRSMQQQLGKQQYFLVGAGAIGCEMLKNFALMGVATEGGEVVVTDMDTIEKSNLNRQFLFRENDVGKLKSQCAAKAVQVMNPAIRIRSMAERVGADSEGIFNDNFWESLSGVVTALDNVDARLYLDGRCVYFQKPMVDSGTLGTKGNTQVVVPFLTESYGSTRDPPEESIPICTLKNFPNKIEHTIQWARDLFEGWFAQAPEEVNKYLSDAHYLAELAKQPNTELETLKTIQSFLVTERPLTFEQCVAWARVQFEKEYNHKIRQLLFVFPEDSVTTTGAKFWSGTKRAPQPLQFDAHDPTHLDFVIAGANLLAFIYGLKGERDPAYFQKVVKQVTVPHFEPQKTKIAENEAEAKKMAEEAALAANHDEQVGAIKAALPNPSTLAGYRLHPVAFEKDDDTNFHMQFITACSNLRARNYRVKEANLHSTKFIAGKIIPALATTTALVTGLVCLELYKILQKKPLEAYRNTFVNLALPLLQQSEPVAPAYTSATLKDRGVWKWSQWDRLEIDGRNHMTLQQLIDHFKNVLGVTISMVSYGSAMLWYDFGNPKKIADRLPMPIPQVVQTVGKVQLRDTDRYVLLEAIVNDDDGNEVPIPSVRVRIQ